MREGRPGIYEVSKNLSFVLIIENSLHFRRSRGERWFPRARRVEDRGLRRDRGEWKEEHKRKDGVPWVKAPVASVLSGKWKKWSPVVS